MQSRAKLFFLSRLISTWNGLSVRPTVPAAGFDEKKLSKWYKKWWRGICAKCTASPPPQRGGTYTLSCKNVTPAWKGHSPDVTHTCWRTTWCPTEHSDYGFKFISKWLCSGNRQTLKQCSSIYTTLIMALRGATAATSANWQPRPCQCAPRLLWLHCSFPPQWPPVWLRCEFCRALWDDIYTSKPLLYYCFGGVKQISFKI